MAADSSDGGNTKQVMPSINHLLFSSSPPVVVKNPQTCEQRDCTLDPDSCLSTAGIESIYYNNFNHNTLGIYDVEEWQADWLTPPWNNNITYNYLADIVSTSTTGKSLQIRYPYDMGTSGGVKWRTDLPGSYNEVYMSYTVRFAQDWDGSADGGKLPGLCGGGCPTGGQCEGGPCNSPTEGFSVRLMFSSGTGRSLKFYSYYNNKYLHLGSYCPPPYDGYNCRWGASEQWNVTITPGSVHTIAIRIVMNTPGIANGLIQGFFDGQLVATRDDIQFLDGSHSFASDKIIFETFFGGGNGPVKDESLMIDDVYVFRNSQVNNGGTTQISSAQALDIPYPACP